MKIWIDGFEANQPQRVGSGQVAIELLKNIEKLDHKNEYTILLTKKPLPDLPKERKGFVYKLIKPSKFKTFIAIPWAILKSKEKPDVFFSPTQYIPRFINIKKVAIIFDLAPQFFPEYYEKKDLYQLNNWTSYTIKNAAHLITISNSSRHDIIKTYNINSKNITVAYPGYDESLFKKITDYEKINAVLKKYQIDEKYILYTGTIQPKKNLVRLIQAFANLINTPDNRSFGIKLKLVITGKYSGEGRQAWMTKETLDAPKRYGVENKVIFTNYLPSDDLPFLIAGAQALVLPSLYEGFGLPPLEAMAVGTPVIVSNVSSLPEVVGDAGLLIDPYRVDQIEQAIRIITTDVKLHSKLSKLGMEQAKKFSWQKMAKEVIKVLESV